VIEMKRQRTTTLTTAQQQQHKNNSTNTIASQSERQWRYTATAAALQKGQIQCKHSTHILSDNATTHREDFVFTRLNHKKSYVTYIIKIINPELYDMIAVTQPTIESLVWCY
jgi:hypothetical protein